MRADAKKAARTAPLTDAAEAAPHYHDLVPPEAIAVTPEPTPPDAEPMTPGSLKSPENTSAKNAQMDAFRVSAQNRPLTTGTGVRVADNQNTLRAGARGPALLEDFHYLDKMGHFDRERIPERVVHARGSGAHGVFQVYESLAGLTQAAFLQDPKVQTPVFVRFSTVQGSRGSADTVRDIRGFATKFYTSEGNFDLVGNNTGVFFMQDAMKFPDFVHAVKPEPGPEVPQGQSAHDSFWDYISLQPETLHNVMWQMSDRAIPRSFRCMEGFGIHTYRLVNAKGQSRFVRFHWKPLAGVASLIWDEAQELCGRDPDFLRKDLWQSIEAGDYPEFELGLQVFTEEEADDLDFDVLDATKIIPEALIPVKRVGRMTLNRNPDNFFAETEQIAFCPANLVPGIDFSDDPLLQGRVFSYIDSQRHRLGTPNFLDLPINRSLVPVRNHQRDGFSRQSINVDAANYEPNSISGNWPRECPPDDRNGGFVTHPAPVEGVKERRRPQTFADYYSHPRLFWLSQTENEQQHIVDAFAFELSKVIRPYIRERVVDLLTRIDRDLAQGVAAKLGLRLSREQLSRDLPGAVGGLKRDPALSIQEHGPVAVKGRVVAILLADGVDDQSLETLEQALKSEGVHSKRLAPHLGSVTSADGKEIKVDGTFCNCPSVTVDAVLVPDGRHVAALSGREDVRNYLAQAYRHLKAIGLCGEAGKLLASLSPSLSPREDPGDPALLVNKRSAALMADFLSAMKKHRAWAREAKTKKD